MNPKESFKKEVLSWLSENGIIPAKVRVYDTRRYGLEVRVYHGTQDMPNMRRSRRRVGEPFEENGRMVTATTVGIHSRPITLYTAINNDALATKEEQEYTLRCLKDNLPTP